MQVSDPNNIKIYNLSAGKSLPDWLSERKRRALQKKNVDIRRRIELIQDFDMPGLSTTVKVSPDGQYILATGIYKPRVKCFEVHNLSMKFERCFDSEVVTFEPISDDYSKLVFLQDDRYIEFHSASGRYYRLRIPKFGHDMKYHFATCDLYVVGTSSDIYRLNLERGQFMSPFTSTGSELNRIAINEHHNLVVVGTKEGKVEAWDPRARTVAGHLDCALNCAFDYGSQNSTPNVFPSVTALKFDGPLHLGVGTATGHVLLYDIRSNKPYRVKDHMYGLPIRDIDFQQGNVLSMDSSVVKIWNRETGALFTSIEAGSLTQFNNLCLVPNSGLMFIANENLKILTYYIPALGTAPRWCSFLDNLTEELEESSMETVYDDYKFVTKKDLEELGLGHLMGTNLLRAYMHGYFIDIRLYRKAKSVADPFAYEKYHRKKIREKIEEERANRVQLKFMLMLQEESGSGESGNSDDDVYMDSGSDDDREMAINLKKQHRLVKLARKRKEMEEEENEDDSDNDETKAANQRNSSHKSAYSFRSGDRFKNVVGQNPVGENRLSLGERLGKGEASSHGSNQQSATGNREMTFSLKKKNKKLGREQEMAKHHMERKNLMRKGPRHLVKPKFYAGPRQPTKRH
ncbi:nucleolar protein 10 [Nilaparvata lugens]|uniref:nucleolar protein 10 n=1 Tax=Nilaparvata lugens TaxID=108931 RepID=UPI00193E52D3|nr:nucleolar protein 10 [Nilaparvata lugens]